MPKINNRLLMTVDMGYKMQNMTMAAVNRVIWARDKTSTKIGMKLARVMLNKCPELSFDYCIWFAKARILVEKLLLSENRSYWWSALPYERNTAEYHNWRINCLNRDDWKCQGDSDNHAKQLNVHHIKSYKNHSALRIDVDNGITMCKKCHKKEHKRLKHGQ